MSRRAGDFMTQVSVIVGGDLRNSSGTGDYANGKAGEPVAKLCLQLTVNPATVHCCPLLSNDVQQGFPSGWQFLITHIDSV